MKTDKFYITSSIAYTNASPHIGYALELIQADVLARHQKQILGGENVFFLTGTDENGVKIEKAAKELGKTPEEFTDEISGKFKDLTKALGLSNNDFIRTTDKKRHWPTVEKVWNKLIEQGDIYKKKYKGLYCVGCEAFVKEKDLVDGKCPNHGKKPELVEEENYFFKLSKYSDKVKTLIEKDEIKIVPEGRKNEILKFIEQEIEDTSCSRSKESLGWGIPVPGDETQIIYVWFEALLNYISALGYFESSSVFKKFWPPDVHCVGKDIFRFHSLLWPAMLIALGLDLPKAILVHGFVTADGQKMSKSLGNVVDPFDLVKKYGADTVRYFLLREISTTEDGDFSHQKFEQRYNNDLAKGLGNLVARVITLAGNTEIKEFQKELKEEIEKTKNQKESLLNEFKINEALSAIWGLIGFCDRYIEKEKPWEGEKKEVIGNLLFAVGNIAEMLDPFLPETAEKIKNQLKTREKENLFPRI
jgi:methionyl-tRNA synthetase